MEFMASLGHGAATPEQALEVLAKTTAQDVANFVVAHSENAMQFAAAGAGDVLYMPKCWFFLEKVGDSHDLTGLEHSLISRSDSAQLEEYNRVSQSCQKSSERAQRVVDFMVVHVSASGGDLLV